MKRRWMVLGLLAGLGSPALADEPAAQQYQQLQSQIQALDQRLGKVETLLQNHGPLSLLKDVEDLKEEVARLKGQTELNVHETRRSGQTANRSVPGPRSSADRTCKSSGPRCASGNTCAESRTCSFSGCQPRWQDAAQPGLVVNSGGRWQCRRIRFQRSGKRGSPG